VQGQNPLALRDQQQAVSSILGLLRLCHLLDGDPVIICALVQKRSYWHGRRALETLLNMRTLTDPQLVLLQKAFANFNWEKRFSIAIIGERSMLLGAEETFRTGTPEEHEKVDSQELISRPTRLFLKSRTETMRDREMTTLIACYSEFLAGLRKGYPNFATFYDEQGAYAKKWDKWTGLISNRRHTIKYPLSNIMAHALTRVAKQVHFAVLDQQLTTTALAIERYRLANRGRNPGTLRELVPNYLLAHPFDPFFGDPLIYHPAPNGSYKLLSAKAIVEKRKAAKNFYTFSVNPATRLK
jgi:hypothetical protein